MQKNQFEGQELNGGFDISRLISRIGKNYYWFIISIGLFTAAAFLYLKYSVPLFQVSSYIQVKAGQEANSLSGVSAFNNGSNQSGQEEDMNSEIFKLQSSSLFAEVVDSLNLFISMSTKGQVKNTPLMLESLPLNIDVKKYSPESSGSVYSIKFNTNHFVVEGEDKSNKFKYKGQYNLPFILDGDTVSFSLQNPNAKFFKETYLFHIRSISSAVSEMTARTTITLLPKGGTGMIQVSHKDEIPERAKAIIEVLVERYDLSNKNFKSRSLRKEIAFLDNRIASVSKELESQENQVSNFKSANKINNVSSSADQLLNSLTTIDNKKSDNKYKETLLSMVENYIGNRNEDRINVSGISDPELNSLVNKYNELVSQKSSIMQNGTANDLRLPGLNTRLGETVRSIHDKISSIREEIGTSNIFLDQQERSTTQQYQVLPEKEKSYIEVNRLLNVKQTLYVFLLQRKEDKTLEYASSGNADSRVVDWIYSNTRTPDPMIVYLIALGIGLGLPLLIIGIGFLTNDKIETFEDIYKATNMTVAGEISYVSKNKDVIHIRKDSVEPIAEQFRTLRTNFFYLSKQMNNKVVMITSNVSGEGKSFVSLNLANSIAISDKKIVLLEFDLRNPVLAKKLGLSDTLGIHNYLTGEVKIDKIIQPVSEYPNLFFISAGTPLTPNPGEIILSQQMSPLFEHLRNNFDYVILDTPPIDAVSDSLTLAKFVDSTIFVIRHKYSQRSAVTLVNQLQKDKKVPNPVLVINGVRQGEGFKNSYGYGYGQTPHLSKKKKTLKMRMASLF